MGGGWSSRRRFKSQGLDPNQDQAQGPVQCRDRGRVQREILSQEANLLIPILDRGANHETKRWILMTKTSRDRGRDHTRGQVSTRGRTHTADLSPGRASLGPHQGRHRGSQRMMMLRSMTQQIRVIMKAR